MATWLLLFITGVLLPHAAAPHKTAHDESIASSTSFGSLSGNSIREDQVEELMDDNEALQVSAGGWNRSSSHIIYDHRNRTELSNVLNEVSFVETKETTSLFSDLYPFHQLPGNGSPGDMNVAPYFFWAIFGDIPSWDLWRSRLSFLFASDIVWYPCKNQQASSRRIFQCPSPNCKDNKQYVPRCSIDGLPCRYYSTGLTGSWVREIISMWNISNALPNDYKSRRQFPSFDLVCPDEVDDQVHGAAGFSKANKSLARQVMYAPEYSGAKQFAYCLPPPYPSNAPDVSLVVFGDAASQKFDEGMLIITLPLIPEVDNYQVFLSSIQLGSDTIQLKPVDRFAIFDAGTFFTTLPQSVYDDLIPIFDKFCKEKGLTPEQHSIAATGSSFHCVNISGKTGLQFPDFVINFPYNNKKMVIPPKYYMFPLEVNRTRRLITYSQDVKCLGFIVAKLFVPITFGAFNQGPFFMLFNLTDEFNPEVVIQPQDCKNFKNKYDTR